MLRLLQENLATVLVGLAMLLLIGLALWGALAPRRRAKRGGCGGGRARSVRCGRRHNPRIEGRRAYDTGRGDGLHDRLCGNSIHGRG